MWLLLWGDVLFCVGFLCFVLFGVFLFWFGLGGFLLLLFCFSLVVTRKFEITNVVPIGGCVSIRQCWSRVCSPLCSEECYPAVASGCYEFGTSRSMVAMNKVASLGKYVLNANT